MLGASGQQRDPTGRSTYRRVWISDRRPDGPDRHPKSGGLLEAASPGYCRVVAMGVFLFTDIEGSTRLWADHRAEMGSALARHDELLSRAVEAAGGEVFKHTG